VAGRVRRHRQRQKCHGDITFSGNWSASDRSRVRDYAAAAKLSQNDIISGMMYYALRSKTMREQAIVRAYEMRLKCAQKEGV
jgi:hypothetical protein